MYCIDLLNHILQYPSKVTTNILITTEHPSQLKKHGRVALARSPHPSLKKWHPLLPLRETSQHLPTNHLKEESEELSKNLSCVRVHVSMYVCMYVLRIGDCLSDYVPVLGIEVNASVMASLGWRLPHGSSLFWCCSGS